MNLIYHSEWKSPTDAVYTVARYDYARSLWGTRIAWASFVISEPALLLANGGVHIRHRGIALPAPHGTEYAMYGGARIILHSAPVVDELPLPGNVGANNILRYHGTNIVGVTDHYASPVVIAQKMLEPGAYRVEMWAGAGTDAQDVDGLAEIFDVNGVLAQFNVMVFA